MKILAIVITVILQVVTATAQDDICACCTEDHKAFDFWLGNWAVTNTDGSAAGQNTIVKDQDNCILRESWTSAAGGFTGSSTNFYNLISGEWEQLWIDNSGNHLKLKGKRIGNQMILSSDSYIRQDGKAYINRISWTANADGTVRQLWEVLHEGRVVNVAFDGLYTKVN